MNKNTTSQKTRVVFAVAGAGAAIWLLIEIAISATHGVAGVAGIRVPPASVSEGEAWGIYGLYAALVLGSAIPLDKTETVKVPRDWPVAFLALVVLTLVPGALLLVPDHAALNTIPPVSLSCGSWLYPTAGTVLFHASPCVAALESRFRWAALVAAAGLAGPYLVMALSLRAQRRASKAATAPGSTPNSPSADSR